MIVWDLIYFWDVCPYTHEELRKRNRKKDIVYWRQVGMFVARQSGMTFVEIGKLFNMHHATAIHGVNQVWIAHNGYNPEQDAIFQAYINRAPRMVDEENIESTSDTCVNEAIGLVIMEGLINKIK